MSESSGSFLIGQLAYVVPTLCVYALAAVLAIVFWSRARAASILTLLSVVVSSAVLLIVPLLQTSFVEMHQEGRLDSSAFSTSMSVVGLAGGIVRTIGLCLLVVAVFVGRSRPAPASA